MSTSNTRQRWMTYNLDNVHQDRRFFPTDRQRELFRALADAVPDNPAFEAGALSLVGYGSRVESA